MSAPLTEGELKAALAREGLHVRPEEMAQVLATARFLQDAARRVREAREGSAEGPA